MFSLFMKFGSPAKAGGGGPGPQETPLDPPLDNDQVIIGNCAPDI